LTTAHQVATSIYSVHTLGLWILNFYKFEKYHIILII